MNWRRFRGVVLFLFIAYLLTLPRCHLIFPYRTVATSYRCTGDVVEYATTVPKPALAKSTNHAGGQLQLIQFMNSNPAAPPPVFYVDAPYKPASGAKVPVSLVGAWLLQVSRKDEIFKGASYLDLEFKHDIQQLIVGYDTRATKLPTWFSQKFQKLPNAVLRSTQKYDYRPPKPGGPVSANVDYQLYTPRTAFASAFSKKFSLGGNNASGVQWRDAPLRDDKTRMTGAQYLVFVKPKLIVDKTKSTVHDQIQVEVCKPAGNPDTEVETAAKKNKDDALEWWLRQDANNKSFEQAYRDGALDLVFGAGPCGEIIDPQPSPKVYKACGAALEIGKKPQALNTWMLRSTASLDPTTTKITAKLMGNVVTKPGRGRLSFRVNEKNQVEIGELSIFAGPFKVSGLEFVWITVGQKHTLVADCNDAMPPGPFRLCNDYIFPVGRLEVGSAAKVSGSKTFSPFKSTQPIPVHVDFNKREFTLSGGPVHGEVEANHKKYPVEIWLDIHTPFDNLAPLASFEEMETRYKCVDNNKAEVRLDASASHDADPGGKIVSYQWLEDAGLPGERILGNTKALTLAMNYGSHRITLIVEDNKGVRDSKTVVVEVYDSKLNGYQGPPDVFTQVQSRGGTRVDIGTGSANDGCSGEAESSNDAPETLLFPPGYTPVEWTFHDFNGNYAKQMQKVFVEPAAVYPPPVAWSKITWNKAGGNVVSLSYDFGTQPQGQAVRANAFILLHTPDGKIYSFDDSGRIEMSRRIVPYGVNDLYGAAPTSSTLLLKRLNAIFATRGAYAFDYILTSRRSGYNDPRTFIAFDRVEFDYPPHP